MDLSKPAAKRVYRGVSGVYSEAYAPSCFASSWGCVVFRFWIGGFRG